MDSIPGLYNNVLVLDFKSLYPSIIKTFHVDPMGLIEGLKESKCEDAQPIAGFDGAFFSREHHFLPQIITELWQARDQAKAEYNQPLSQAIKIIMNSFYGVLGSTGCRFYDPRLSGSITKRSHQLLKQTKQWIEQKGYTVIYGDTDSIFVHAGDDLTLEASRALGAELAQYINKKMREFIHDNANLESYLEIEFETHFSKFFMPTIRGKEVGTKKRYAGMIETPPADNTRSITKEHGENGRNGKNSQQLVFKGLETVRTDWTALAKEFQQTIYQRVFNDLPTAEYINSVVTGLCAGKLDDKLIYRKRIRRKLSDYVKNVPPHVKAARLADLQNKEQGKPLKYQRGGWIEYYMTLNGPQAKEHLTAPLDYDFYIERQLLTIADAILPFVGTSFNHITDAQLTLFS